MFYQEEWWGIWVGQNSLFPKWTYYFYKLCQHQPYQYQHHQITMNDNITSQGLSPQQAKNLRTLGSKINSGTLFQQANQLSLRAEDISPNCKWNTFVINSLGYYAGFFAVLKYYDKYLTGQLHDNAGKVSAAYILVCVRQYDWVNQQLV